MTESFKLEIDQLKRSKQELRAVQKKYFKAGEKLMKQSEYRREGFEKAKSKEEIEKYRNIKLNELEHYKKEFSMFRGLYSEFNTSFELRTRDLLAFDTQLKKDYCLNWELFSTKIVEDIEFKKLQNRNWQQEDFELDCDIIFEELLPENKIKEAGNRKISIQILLIILILISYNQMKYFVKLI